MRNLVPVIAAVTLLAGTQVGDAKFVTSYSENFDESFSGANMNPSAQGSRVDDSQEQVGWAASPGYYTASGATTKPWTPVSPAVDFTGGGDGALLLGPGAGHARTTSTADTMGLGTYSWEFEWEDFHGGLPPSGTDLHEEGNPTSPGEKRLSMVLLSDKSGGDHGGDTNFPLRGVEIIFGQTGTGGGLFVGGKRAGAFEGKDRLFTYSPASSTGALLSHTGPESRPWIKLAGASNHTDGLKIHAEAKIVEDDPGVYLLDLMYGQTDDPDTAANEYFDTVWLEINDLDVSQYITDVQGGVGAPNGYWNIAAHDAGWIKVDNLSFTGPDPPVVDGLPGDYNNSGTVDAADFTVYQDNLGSSSAALNGNGTGSATVVITDYQHWSSNFGSTSGSASGSAVPEPGCLVLLAIALTAVSSLRPIPANR